MALASNESSRLPWPQSRPPVGTGQPELKTTSRTLQGLLTTQRGAEPKQRERGTEGERDTRPLPLTVQEHKQNAFCHLLKPVPISHGRNLADVTGQGWRQQDHCCRGPVQYPCPKQGTWRGI